jgi:hypothetical protein
MLKVIEDKKTKQLFMLQCGKKKIHFKVDKDNEQSKQMFIELLNKTINECIITRKNMEDITQHKDNTDDSVVDINKSKWQSNWAMKEFLSWGTGSHGRILTRKLPS